MVEFDRHLSQIQGCLLSGQNILQNLTDPEKCQELSYRVNKILKNCPPDYETRNIFLYLLLNSDAAVTANFEEDENFSHLVNTAPSQSLTLVLQVILKLSGLKFLRDIVTFAPMPLSVCVMEAFLDQKGFDLASYQGRTVVSVELSKACYHRIVLGRGENIVFLQKYISYFKALQSFNFLYLCEDMHHSTYSTYELGIAFLQNLEVCLFCCEDQTLRDQSKIWTDFLMHFKPKFQICMLEDNSEPRNYCKQLCECRDLIISKCKMLAQAISVDVWLDWAEVDFEPTRCLQQVIGERVYECKRKLETLMEQPSVVLTNFLEILSNFVINPKNEDDEIKNASMEVIKANLSNTDKCNKKWVKALLQQNSVLENDETIHLIQSNCMLLDEDDVTFLLRKLAEMIMQKNEKDLEAIEILQRLSYQVMKHLKLEGLLKIYDRNGRDYGFSLVFCGSDFNLHLLEAFNKTTSGSEECADEWRCELVRLAVQNTQGVIKHAVGAALSDFDSAKIMLEILILLKSVSTGIILEWISKLPNSYSFHGVQFDNFPKLVLEFTKENLLPTETLTKLHIMPGIHQAIHDHNWEIVSMWLTSLQYVLDDCGGNPEKLCRVAALLAYVGQIIEYTQQLSRNFTLSCVVARQKALGILQSLRNITLEESDKDWLYNLITKYSVMTQCHFEVFIHDVQAKIKEDSSSGTPLLFEHCFDNRVKSPEHATHILVKLVPFLTTSEWKGLAVVLKQKFVNHDDCGFSLFQAFRQTLLLLATACATINFDDDSYDISCLNYCVRCLGTIMKADVLPVLKHSNILLVLEETFHLLSKLPAKVWERGGMYILPVLVSLMQEVQPEVDTFNVLSAVLSTCPTNQGRTILENKMKELFQDAINEDTKSL